MYNFVSILYTLINWSNIPINGDLYDFCFGAALSFIYILVTLMMIEIEKAYKKIYSKSSKGKITPVPQLVPNLCSFILFIYVHKYYSIHALMYVAALAIIQFWGRFVGCLVSRLHGLNGPMSRIDIRSIWLYYVAELAEWWIIHL